MHSHERLLVFLFSSYEPVYEIGGQKDGQDARCGL